MDFEDFNAHFQYKDGLLIRKTVGVSKKAHEKIGEVVGSPDAKGYLNVGHRGKYYKVHRIIYLLQHGSCPKYVDHINGVKTDNRIENLRAADISTNHYNCKLYSSNTSGTKGVYWHKSNQKWAVQISVRGTVCRLGFYTDINEARRVVLEARAKYHGEFANTGEQ